MPKSSKLTHPLSSSSFMSFTKNPRHHCLTLFPFFFILSYLSLSSSIITVVAHYTRDHPFGHPWPPQNHPKPLIPPIGLALHPSAHHVASTPWLVALVVETLTFLTLERVLNTPTTQSSLFRFFKYEGDFDHSLSLKEKDKTGNSYFFMLA